MQGRFSYLRIIGAERGQPRAQVVLRGAPGLREQPGGIQISCQPLSDPGTQGWLLSDLPQPIALQEGLHKLAEPIEPPQRMSLERQERLKNRKWYSASPATLSENPLRLKPFWASRGLIRMVSMMSFSRKPAIISMGNSCMSSSRKRS